MKTQKWLPGTQLSGKIIDNKIKEFNVNGKAGIEFTIVLQDVWKDKDGNKQKSEPYYAECTAFGDTKVQIIKDLITLKQMAVLRVLPKLEKWIDKETGREKSKTKFMVSRAEGWYYESGEWICSEDRPTSNDDLPF